MVVCSSWLGQLAAAVASITGLVAKENIVGTLGILYGGSGSVYANIAASFTAISGFSFMVFNLYVPLVLQQWVQSKEKCIMRNGLRLQLLINVCLPMQLLW